MEIISFTFAVLSVVIAIFIATTVLSILKIVELQKQVKELEAKMTDTHKSKASKKILKG
jgi:predicted Holliday junction resolvase-like endonuclease